MCRYGGERVIKKFENKFPENNFNVKISEKVPPVHIDARRIEQVFDNFLENAVKYSPTDKNVWLQMDYLPEEKLIKVGVIDRGIGIAFQDQKVVFERFCRLEKACSIQATGNGIGLSIVNYQKSWWRNMGGKCIRSRQ